MFYKESTNSLKYSTLLYTWYHYYFYKNDRFFSPLSFTLRRETSKIGTEFAGILPTAWPPYPKADGISKTPDPPSLNSGIPSSNPV